MRRSYEVFEDDLAHISGQFIKLAKHFIGTGITIEESPDGNRVPLLTVDNHKTFLPMLFNTLKNILAYLKSKISFDPYEDCSQFCRLILNDSIYGEWDILSPKLILMQECGVFLGAYQIAPLQSGSFCLKYGSEFKTVRFHRALSFMPTIGGKINKNLDALIVDVLTQSEGGDAFPSIGEYIRDHCASAREDGRQKVEVGLFYESYPGEEDKISQYNLSTVSGNSFCYRLVSSRLFLSAEEQSNRIDEQAVSREIKHQLHACSKLFK